MKPVVDFLKRMSWMPLFGAAALTGVPPANGEEVPRISLAEFSRSVGRAPWKNATFRLEASVRSLSSDRRFVALQDGSGSAVLECDGIPQDATVGQGLAIEGKGCCVFPDRFALRISRMALTLDSDGLHETMFRSGTCQLEAGLQPFQLDWFNATGIAELALEYEGPGLARGPVPKVSFQHSEAPGSSAPGVRYKAFLRDQWERLDDARGLTPVTEGIAPDLGLEVLPRREQVGISFDGLLTIPKTGPYTFHLGSDDGSRLVLGNALVSCKALVGFPFPPEAEEWTGGLAPNDATWTKAAGEVSFASRNDGRLELEILGENSSCKVIVLDPGSLQPGKLLRRRVELTGLGRSDGIVVVTAGDLSISGDAQEEGRLLTQAIEVRRLQPVEARKPYHARIRGVVTTCTSEKLVVQDPTGGVFVWYNSPASGILPRPGELWEIDGVTDPGHFCPIIINAEVKYLGRAAMPRPIRPTWDEIAAGNLDSEVVEIEGVVVSANSSAMTILLRDGTVQVSDDDINPLPYRWLSDTEKRALPGSVVRIRGVYLTYWDGAGRIISGICMLGNASMTIDAPAPTDPFAGPAMPISDVLLFTSQTGAFKSVRIAGQVLYSHAPVHILSDGGKGFRVWSRNGPELRAGDQVEVAGFPRFVGSSPAIVEANLRKVGEAALPEPREVPADALPDASLDATRVKTEAVLLNDLLREEERLLEVESGSRRFLARMIYSGEDFKPIQSGSTLEIVGIYSSGMPGDRGTGSGEFELLVSNPADVVVLRHGPWWTTTHTIAAIGLLSGGMLVAGCWVLLLRRTVSVRTKELAKEIEVREIAERRREVEQERTRVAHDLHDELGAALTEVGMLASLVKSTAVSEPQKEGYLDRLGEVSYGLVTALDEVVWAVNPRYDSVAGLAEYFSLYTQRFLELPGIRCRRQISASVGEYPLGSHQRHEIFLAFREALNNIVRHSQASEVLLFVDVDAGGLKIRLSDNGQGFDAETDQPSGCDGLISINERVARLGGLCDIRSAPGEGTTVEIRLPLERSGS